MRKRMILHSIGKLGSSPYLRLVYILAAVLALALAGGAPEIFGGA